MEGTTGAPSPEKRGKAASCDSGRAKAPSASMLQYAVARYTMDFFTDVKSRLGEELLSDLMHDLKAVIEAGCEKEERILKEYPEGFDVLIRFAGRSRTDRRIREWFNSLKTVFKGFGGADAISFSGGVYELAGAFRPAQIEKYAERAAFAQSFGRISGNPFVRYYCNEDFQIRRRYRRLESQIGAAIGERQLQVYLQPQYSLFTRKIAGAEALVRWNHPRLGLIMPDDFIPLFERDHFIIDMDFYVLEECCKILRRWHSSGFPCVPISVNFSRLHAATDDFLPRFLAMIETYRIRPDEIRVEWTESAFAEGNEPVSRLARQLRSKKFLIAMDDFGAGYSSLNSLPELPVDVIKLDKRFLQFEKDDSRRRCFLQRVIMTANALQYTVLAEGVEFPWQSELLEQMGCEYIQGFLYGRPLPIPDYEDLVRSQENGGQETGSKPPGSYAEEMEPAEAGHVG